MHSIYHPLQKKQFKMDLKFNKIKLLPIEASQCGWLKQQINIWTWLQTSDVLLH